MRTLLRILGLASLLLVSNGSAGAQEPTPDGGVRVTDVRVSEFPPRAGDTTGPAYRQEFEQPGAEDLRIRIGDLTLAEGDILEITDLRDAVIDRVVGPFASNEGYLSPVVPGPIAIVTIAAADIAGVASDPVEIVYEAVAGQLLSISGDDDMRNVLTYIENAEFYPLTRSIVFLSFVLNNRPYVCSGFLIARDRILTNEHCVSTEAICRTTIVVFDYLFENNAVTTGPQLRCQSVVKADSALDYAVLQLDGTAPEEIGVLPFAPARVPAGTQAFLVQHPAGYPKIVSEVGCTILGETAAGISGPTDFTHRCDTVGGSSGSPLLASLTGPAGAPAFCVAGLHHLGFSSFGQYVDMNRAVWSDLIVDSLSEAGIQIERCA